MGVRLPRISRKIVFIGLITLIVLIGGAIGAYYLTKSDKKSNQPKTAEEVAKSQLYSSLPGDAYVSSLTDFASKTTNISEKYEAYRKLCDSYNTLNKLEEAKANCNKAIEYAVQANISSTELDLLKNQTAFINAKLQSQKEPPPPNPTNYEEPSK